MNKRFYIKLIENPEPDLQGFTWNIMYYSLFIKVPYKNCFCKIKRKELDLNTCISTTRASSLRLDSETKLLNYLVNEFNNKRRKSKLYRNIKRKQ